MIIVLVLAIALGVAVARGGRISNLANIRFRWIYLLTLPLLIQIVLFSPLAGLLGLQAQSFPSLYILSMGIAALVVWANRTLPGFQWLLAGLFSNVIVILANGGYMPVWMTAREWVGQSSFSGVHNNIVEMTSNTPLWFLGDIIPVPPPIPFANVLSFGDVLISLGAVWFIQRVLVPGRPHPPAA